MSDELNNTPESCDSPDGELFSRLLVTNRRRIHGFIFTLVHDSAAAEDIFQDVSVVLWKKFSTFEEGTDFGAWAMAVARYSVLNWRRKQQKLPFPMDDETLTDLADQALVVSCESDERRDHLRICLNRLSPKNLDLMVDHYQRGKPAKEIAEEANYTTRRIHQLLDKCRRFLLDCIEQQTLKNQQE